MFQIVVYAIPVFALLLIAEFAYGCVVGRNTYRIDDAISSLSQGLMSQITAVVTQLFQIGLYTLVYAHVAQWRNDVFWDAWYGWLIAIVFFDFCDYWLHRVGHETAVFWAAHVVHHQSQDFNFSTALRQESAVVLLGWAFYLPMAVAGIPPETFAIAGMVVLYYQFWIHTEHIGKLGWFDKVFSSPSNHRVHHAVNDQYINKNYGGMLIIWDRLFGTFAEEKEKCIYGTRTPLNSWNPLWALVQVYWLIARDAWRTRNWLDKLRIWWMPAGWRPADVAVAYPEAEFELSAVRLHNPPVSSAQLWVAGVQFLLLLGAVCAYLWVADGLSYPLALSGAVSLVAGLWVVGAVLQGKMGLGWATLAQGLALAGVGWVTAGVMLG